MNSPSVVIRTGPGLARVYIGGANNPAGEVVVEPGPLYVVQPSNKQKKMHRGRVCTFLGLDFRCWQCGSKPAEGSEWNSSCAECGTDRWGSDFRARVKFQDTGRVGLVDACDLRYAEGVANG